MKRFPLALLAFNRAVSYGISSCENEQEGEVYTIDSPELCHSKADDGFLTSDPQVEGADAIAVRAVAQGNAEDLRSIIDGGLDSLFDNLDTWKGGRPPTKGPSSSSVPTNPKDNLDGSRDGRWKGDAGDCDETASSDGRGLCRRPPITSATASNRMTSTPTSHSEIPEPSESLGGHGDIGNGAGRGGGVGRGDDDNEDGGDLEQDDSRGDGTRENDAGNNTNRDEEARPSNGQEGDSTITESSSDQARPSTNPSGSDDGLATRTTAETQSTTTEPGEFVTTNVASLRSIEVLPVAVFGLIMAALLA